MARPRIYTNEERRARCLVKNYNSKDAEYGRGKGDLDYLWVIDNIFSKPCAHCGKTGWDIIGCNRLDNSKPHTKDNVEPCCNDCNNKLAGKEKKCVFGNSIDQIDMNSGEVIASFISEREAAKEVGYSKSNISYAANGGYFKKGKWITVTQTHGSLWKYIKKGELSSQIIHL